MTSGFAYPSPRTEKRIAIHVENFESICVDADLVQRPQLPARALRNSRAASAVTKSWIASGAGI